MLYDYMNSSELRIHVAIVKISFPACHTYITHVMQCDVWQQHLINFLTQYVRMCSNGFANVLIRAF